MPLLNPSYIEQFARHTGAVIRATNYQAMEGMEGVLLPDHLRVVAGGTPGAFIGANPGVYAVNCRHQGGAFESYVGKIQSALDVGPSGDGTVPVSAVSSAGPRTDLVILRVENPYVVGAGSWPEPSDKVNGPYAHIRVIENVPANINHVSAFNNTWSAITLARITRPASTNVVQAAHITDLRSLANPAGQRIIIVDTPPAEPPPIAQQVWTGTAKVTTTTTLLASNLTFLDFPTQGIFQVPIPAWATSCDIVVLLNPELSLGNINGEQRIVIDSAATNLVPTEFNFDRIPSTSIQQYVTMIAGTFAIPAGKAGKVVTMKTQARSSISDGAHVGRLRMETGCIVAAQLNFKRNPA